MVHGVKIPGARKIVPPQRKAFEYESKTSSAAPRLHTSCLVIAKRGGGKTTLVANMLEQFFHFDVVCVISPTFKSNLELMKRMRIRHVIEDTTPNAIAELKTIVNGYRDELEEYWEHLEQHKEVLKRLHTSSDVDRTLWEIIEEGLAKYMEPPPPHEFGGKKPCICCIIDDCVGSSLYSKSREINSLSILHRHLGQIDEKWGGGACGCSLFYLVQSYKAQSGGLSRCIRNNVTLICLFSTKSTSELLEIAEECAGEISKEDFMDAYEYAIQKPHDFLMIDLHPKPGHTLLRRNLDEFIIL